MQIISFSMTTPQVLAMRKTVTRRVGWATLQPGARLRGVEKAQGLKRGEHVRDLAIIRVIAVNRERLDALLGYLPEELAREGFSGMAPADFIAMFCRSHKGCTPATVVTRIEFEYVSLASAFV